MPSLEANLDAQLFEAIHGVLALQDEATWGSNRRETQRHEYRCVQLVAPYDGRNLPSTAHYAHVLCRDLSPGGFSFHSTTKAASRSFIVALGRTPFQFFESRVVNERPVEIDGQPQWVIGCRFVGRIG